MYIHRFYIKKWRNSRYSFNNWIVIVFYIDKMTTLKSPEWPPWSGLYIVLFFLSIKFDPSADLKISNKYDCSMLDNRNLQPVYNTGDVHWSSENKTTFVGVCSWLSQDPRDVQWGSVQQAMNSVVCPRSFENHGDVQRDNAYYARCISPYSWML